MCHGTEGVELNIYRDEKGREHLTKAEACEARSSERFVGQCGSRQRPRGKGKASADFHTKTHVRHGSSASDGEGGKGWMSLLLGENTGGTEGSMEEDNTLSESEPEDQEYIITNMSVCGTVWDSLGVCEGVNEFWYHLFFFATALGGELFYSVFFCFWAWNVDGAVLRRVIMVWMVTMYIGQLTMECLGRLRKVRLGWKNGGSMV
ncbi:Sphingosine-1-phosphate phosphatase 1 [Portunus trituberculatus]|uniref:Sphingosine-1-phosphate phosphatase 1 n=1 Tax=Portunus trituberculatus TaxID=210409 RepID=A0A5B7FAU9_PORTR|nr:Sphingosine-1-phosphate phosphatase 1 [Portunus trituberculatus]